jgi:hypothetical protein
MPTLKGAFLKFDTGLLGLPNIVIFQFNPETVSRTPSLSIDTSSERRDPTKVMAAPSESFSFSLRLDATDQLAEGNPIAVISGILPALSALELLLYPVPATGGMLKVPGSSGAYAYPPANLPVVMFFWGPFRILPVNVTSMSINELQYDRLLNPIRAEVSVNLQVVTPTTLSSAPTNYRNIMEGAYTYSQTVKEVMAAINLANTAEQIAALTIPL